MMQLQEQLKTSRSEFGTHLQSWFLGINVILADSSYVPKDLVRNPIARAAQKPGQCIPKSPAHMAKCSVNS